MVYNPEWPSYKSADDRECASLSDIITFNLFAAATREDSSDSRLPIITLFKLTSPLESSHLIRFSCFAKPYLEWCNLSFSQTKQRSKLYFLYYFALKLTPILLSWSCYHRYDQDLLYFAHLFHLFFVLSFFQVSLYYENCNDMYMSRARDTLVVFW